MTSTMIGNEILRLQSVSDALNGYLALVVLITGTVAISIEDAITYYWARSCKSPNAPFAYTHLLDDNNKENDSYQNEVLTNFNITYDDSFQNDIAIFSSTTSVNGCADLSHSNDDHSFKDDDIISLNQTIPSYNNNNNIQLSKETNSNDNDKSNHTIDLSQSNNHDIDQTIKQTAKLILLKGAAIRNAALKFFLDETLIEYGNFLINQTKRTSTVYQGYLKSLPSRDNTNHTTEYVKHMKFLLSLSKLDLSEDDYKLSFKSIDQLSNHIETSIKCTKGTILSLLGQQHLEEYNNLIWYDKTCWHIRMDDEVEDDEICDTAIDELTQKSLKRSTETSM
ncbi:unnamed protein product [Rotaria sordida]|uniref:Uncharacterized protein n=1 Tax=Rotaria sordida TaxID=392033 RepID=A0A813WWN9_9BILA|nr:unnamed protein product [Rotaria sordida]